VIRCAATVIGWLKTVSLFPMNQSAQRAVDYSNVTFTFDAVNDDILAESPETHTGYFKTFSMLNVLRLCMLSDVQPFSQFQYRLSDEIQILQADICKQTARDNNELIIDS
jgi:hypothetical protein